MLLTSNTENLHQDAYQGKYEKVKMKVLSDNRALTSVDDVSNVISFYFPCFIVYNKSVYFMMLDIFIDYDFLYLFIYPSYIFLTYSSSIP